MRFFKTILILILLFTVVNVYAQKYSGAQFYHIPAQNIKPYLLIGLNDSYSYLGYQNPVTRENQRNYQLSVGPLKISKQITFGEYKKYLNAIKRDSSEEFYLKQLPDSTMCNSKVYHQYLTDTLFNSFPVLGVSWESAMNYCKWITFAENKSGTIEFIYRLPICSE